MTGERKALEALRTAQNLAIALHNKHYAHVENWRVADDLTGVILQIDNMSSALAPEASPQVEVVAWEAECRPQVIHFEEANRSELVLTDAAHVYAEDVVVQAVRSMDSREIVGFAWEGVEPAAPPSPAPVSGEDENTKLRSIISKVCAALPNGAYCSPTASVEFMEHVPAEVASVIASLTSPAAPAGGSDV